MAQPRLPLHGQAMDFTAAELQTTINAYPGGNAEIKSIDAGKHVVDLWLEQRKPGLTTPAGENGIAHAEITEIPTRACWRLYSAKFRPRLES